MGKYKQNAATSKVKIQRIGRDGALHRIIPIVDDSGNVIDHVVKPLMVEFTAKDVLQTILGASFLAIPAAYTEETWDLGRELPGTSIIGIALLSVICIATFVYFNFYRKYLVEFKREYLFRVVNTYLIAFCLAAIVLTLIQQCPWGVDNVLALKRIIIVAFPASMSGTVTDSLK